MRDQAAGSSHRNTLGLSCFTLRAGWRRVTVGLHFWQTRGSFSLTRLCTTPPWLPAAAIKPRQPEPTNKKANTPSIDSGQLWWGGVERSTLCRRLSLGSRVIIGVRENCSVWSHRRNTFVSVDHNSEPSLRAWTHRYQSREEKQPEFTVSYYYNQANPKWASLSPRSIGVPCRACVSPHFLINTSTHWRGQLSRHTVPRATLWT